MTFCWRIITITRRRIRDDLSLYREKGETEKGIEDTDTTERPTEKRLEATDTTAERQTEKEPAARESKRRLTQYSPNYR